MQKSNGDFICKNKNKSNEFVWISYFTLLYSIQYSPKHSIFPSLLIIGDKSKRQMHRPSRQTVWKWNASHCSLKKHVSFIAASENKITIPYMRKWMTFMNLLWFALQYCVESRRKTFWIWERWVEIILSWIYESRWQNIKLKSWPLRRGCNKRITKLLQFFWPVVLTRAKTTLANLIPVFVIDAYLLQ